MARFNFGQYSSLLSSIPPPWTSWKKPTICKRSSSQRVHRFRWSAAMTFGSGYFASYSKNESHSVWNRNDWSKFHKYTFFTKEINLAMFQFKVIHRILPWKSLTVLHKMNKVYSPYCPVYPFEIRTIWHLFKDCAHAASFWVEFQNWYCSLNGAKPDRTFQFPHFTWNYSFFSTLFGPRSLSHCGKILFVC